MDHPFPSRPDWTTELLTWERPLSRPFSDYNQASANSSASTCIAKILLKFILPNSLEALLRAVRMFSSWNTSRRMLVWLNHPNCTNRCASRATSSVSSKLAPSSVQRTHSPIVICASSLDSILRWRSRRTTTSYSTSWVSSSSQSLRDLRPVSRRKSKRSISNSPLSHSRSSHPSSSSLSRKDANFLPKQVSTKTLSKILIPWLRRSWETSFLRNTIQTSTCSIDILSQRDPSIPWSVMTIQTTPSPTTSLWEDRRLPQVLRETMIPSPSPSVLLSVDLTLKLLRTTLNLWLMALTLTEDAALVLKESSSFTVTSTTLETAASSPEILAESHLDYHQFILSSIKSLFLHISTDRIDNLAYLWLWLYILLYSSLDQS